MVRYRVAVIGIYAYLSLIALPTSICGQRPIDRVTRTAAVPSPKSVLGFEPGDDRTIADWGQITNYFNLLDKSSDRVLVQNLGQSTLKRPLIVAFISARENILALEKYKDIQRQLADPRLVTGPTQRDQLISSG